MSSTDPQILKAALEKERQARIAAENSLDKIKSGVISASNDDSEKKLSNTKAPILKEDRIKLALEKIGDNFWEHDFQTGITTFSKQVEELLGFSNIPSQEIDQLWWSRIHPDDVQTLKENDIKNRGGIIENHNLEYRMLHNDGSIIWILDRGVVLERDEWGTPLSMIGSHANITRLKNAEEALRKSEQRWQFALEGSGDGIWEYNVKTKETFYSKQYKKMLGYAEEETLAQFSTHLNFVHADDKAVLLEILEDYQIGRIQSHSLEYRVQHKNGYYIWILDRGMVTIYRSDGGFARITGTYSNIDITKKTELELKATATRLTSLIGNLQSAILLEDKDRRLITTNQKFCDMFHIAVTPQTLIGLDCGVNATQSKNLFADEDGFILSIEQHLKSLKTTVGEILPLKDGRILSRDFIPIQQDEGSFIGILWVYNDVTESTNIAKALEKQRSFYEGILNNIPTDIAIFDPDHRYLFLNPIAIKNEKIRKWIIGKTDDDYFEYRNFPREQLKIREEKWNEAINHKKIVSWEEDKIDPTGNFESNLRNLYPIYDAEGNLLQVMGYGINITERKKFEQEIALREKRYRDLIHYSIGLIVTHDLDGRFLTINPAVAELLGVKSDWIIGKNILNLLPRKTKEAFTNVYLPEIKNKGKAEGVFKYWNKEGDPLYLLFKNVLVSEPGNTPYVIGFAQDITDRILAQKELEIAKKATEESAAAKGQFLANMSHEIRTPMNGILGLASLLEKTELNTEQRSFLDMILTSAQQLLVIINDFLDLEKIGSGKIQLEKIPFALNEKISQATEMFRFKAKEKHIGLEVKTEVADDFWILGDPYRLVQIMNNLLGNAIKFTHHGGIIIYISAIPVSGSQQRVTIRVEDTGIGIHADNLPGIFDPYVQEKSDVARIYGGSGLGLAISRSLAEMQDGKLYAESLQGVGSAFTIEIPFETVAPLQINEEENKGEINKKRFSGTKILVAEDVTINQFLVKYILTSWDCIVRVVSNGEEVVNALEEEDYDVLLMDIQMPVLDGIKATKIIRKMDSQVKRNVPIIALTANALRDDDKKYRLAGMNGYLTKPFTEAGLFESIDKVLKENQLLNKENVENIDQSNPSPPIKQNDKNYSMIYNLDMLKEMCGGDKSFLTMMIQLFVDTVPEIITQMKTASKAGNWVEVGGLAHKVKPTIDSMGIESLKEVIRDIEMQGKSSSNTENIPDKVETVTSTLQECIDQMKKDFSL